MVCVAYTVVSAQSTSGRQDQPTQTRPSPTRTDGTPTSPTRPLPPGSTRPGGVTQDQADTEGEDIDEQLEEPVIEEEEPEVEEPEPPTAAERFALLERFGMRIFGYVPEEPAPEQPAPEQTSETRSERSDTPAEEAGAQATETERPQTPAQPERARPPRQVPTPTDPRLVTQPSAAGGLITSEPVPPTYVIGPGDELVLRVWTDAIEHVQANPVVDADGSIYLELLGEVTVAGERLSRVREMLAQRYQVFFDRAQVSVGLSRTRVIEVRVAGDVRQPGLYRLSGSATIFTALYAAGGPNEVGSFRAIKLARRGEEPVILDLYDFLLSGDTEVDVALEPNDTVFVPPLTAEFGVDGQVRRPARYELKGALTVADALQMAAGIAPTGYSQSIELWRAGGSGVRQLINVNLQDGLTHEIQGGDLLVVNPIIEEPDNVVQLEGATRRPGAFQIRDGMRVSDLMQSAQGPTEQAHMAEAAIWRLTDDFDYERITFNLSAALAGDPRHNLPLRPRDRVIIFTKEEAEAPREVVAEGAVRTPGTVEWAQGMRVSDLLKQVGGLAEGAFTPRANLLRLGEDQRREVIPIDLGEAIRGVETANCELQRGDKLLVFAREEVAPANEINVVGEVREPGWYVRPQGMRVSDAILAAGGVLATAGNQVQYTQGGVEGSVEPIYLAMRRTDDGVQVEPDPVVRDNDLVSVPGSGDFIASPPVVSIRGRVSRPGSYALQSTSTDPDTVYDLIARAGGLLTDGNPGGIVLYRLREEIIREEQQTDLTQVIAHLNREISAATVEGEEQRSGSTADAIAQGLQVALSEGSNRVIIAPRRLSETQWARAVPIDGEKLIATEGREGDMPLLAGDLVVVGSLPTTITVIGAVVRPGAVSYEEGLQMRDYLPMVGGYTEDAHESRTMIIRANGSVTPMKSDTQIRPGDIVLVPSDYVFRTIGSTSTWEKVVSTITAVLGGYLIFR